MNALQTSAVVATSIAGASVALVHGLRPRRRSIADVRAILAAPPHALAGPGGRGAAARGSVFTAPVMRPIVAVAERRLGSGLRLLDQTVAEVLARVLVSFLAGTVVVALIVTSLVATGTLPVTPLWLVAALAVGAAMAWIMWSDTLQKIVRRRRELQRVVNEFVQLVALGLTTDQSVEEAVQFAIHVGEDDDLWEILRREVATAPQRGIPLWDALDRLGTTYDQRELSELATSIERQGTQGVSITDTVTTLAASMRARALDELERAADKVNANLAGPTVAFVVTMIVFLAYPLALRISEAFGG